MSTKEIEMGVSSRVHKELSENEQYDIMWIDGQNESRKDKVDKEGGDLVKRSSQRYRRQWGR